MTRIMRPTNQPAKMRFVKRTRIQEVRERLRSGAGAVGSDGTAAGVQLAVVEFVAGGVPAGRGRPA